MAADDQAAARHRPRTLADAVVDDQDAEIARLREQLRISYPATPVDCLISELTDIAQQSFDEAMYEDFIERLRQWQQEKDQVDAE